MAQCVLEENKIKKSSRVVKGKKNLYEALQTKLANIDSEIIQYKWEMKRKPLFHKYDAIYALKKKTDFIVRPKTKNKEKNVTYFALIKRGNDFVEMEIHVNWLKDHFVQEFLDYFEAHQDLDNAWCTVGKSPDQLVVLPNDNNDYDTLITAPVKRYVDPNLETTWALVRKIKIICYFSSNEVTNFQCDKQEFAMFCPECTDEEYPSLTSHDYEMVTENVLKDEIGVDYVTQCIKNCYKIFYTMLDEEKEIPEEHTDIKDSFVQQEIESIFMEKTHSFYFDVTHLGIKCNLKLPQVCKMRYDFATDQFRGMSISVNSQGFSKVEKFELTKEWVKDNYSNEIVDSVMKQSQIRKDGRFLAVPVGDIIDQDTIDNMIYLETAPTNKYLQKNNDRCAFCSLASALAMIGFLNEAAHLIEYMDYFYEKEYTNDFQRILQHIVNYFQKREVLEFKNFRTKYIFERIKRNHKGQMKDIFTMKREHNYIYWITLHQKDGSRSHTICVVNDWIIDSNFEKGLLFNEVNLNMCCNKSSYERISDGYVVRPI